MLKDGSTSQYFRTSQAPVEKQIYMKALHTPDDSFVVSSVAEGIEKVRGRKYADFAFITESALAKRYIQKKPCNLYLVSENLVSRHYALAFPHGASEIRERMNLALLQLQGNGELAFLENKWFSGSCKKTVLEYSEDIYRPPEAHPLDLGSFSGALCILAVGIIFGSIVTLIEVAIYRWAEAVSIV